MSPGHETAVPRLKGDRAVIKLGVQTFISPQLIMSVIMTQRLDRLAREGKGENMGTDKPHPHRERACSFIISMRSYMGS